MKKLELEQYGVQEMDAMKTKETNGGFSFYQYGPAFDKASYLDGDAVVSFFEGLFHGFLKN